MFSLRIASLILGGLSATVVILLEVFDHLDRKIIAPAFYDRHAELIVALIVLVIAFVLTLFGVNALVYSLRTKVKERDSELIQLRSEMEMFQRKARIAERKWMTDFVTGIPNKEKWKVDMERMTAELGPADHCCLIFLDIDNFKRINDTYGYVIADRIITFLANAINDSMRRNEEIYKMPMTDSDPDFDLERSYRDLSRDGVDEASAFTAVTRQLWQRIYKTYSGGDEFIVVVRGLQADALGLLIRIWSQFQGDYLDHINRMILPAGTKPLAGLSFHAAVSPLAPRADFEGALADLQSQVRRAKQRPESTRYVEWQPAAYRSDLENFSFIPVVRLNYEKAETLFAKGGDPSKS